MDVVHLVNRRLAHSSQYKDCDFSRLTVLDLWNAGREDVNATLTHPEWLNRTQQGVRVRTFELPSNWQTPTREATR